MSYISRGRTSFHGEALHPEAPGDGRSPRQVASMDASRSICRLTSMIETARHVVDKLVSYEQAQGRKAQQ
eukprot:2556998-Prorocentrum_lima.AAC.1